MKNFLIIQLSASQKKIWANQFDSAEIALQKTKAAGFDYGLLNDPDFSSAMDKYRGKIHDQQCRNLKDSVDLRIIRADRSAALKNYINATRYYREAWSLTISDSTCRLNQKSLNDSLSKYKEPSDFQKTEYTVNAMVAIGDYTGVMKLLTENQLLFKNAKLQRFGLQALNIHEFISMRNNPYLTQTAACFYIDGSQPREAFVFLLLLRDQNVAAKQVKTLQEKLGQALAKTDLAVNPGEDATTALRKYPVEVDWFNVFRAAYSAERERQVKSVRPGSK